MPSPSKQNSYLSPPIICPLTNFILHLPSFLTFGPQLVCAPHEQTTAQTSAENETSSEVSIKCVCAYCLSLPNKLPETKQLAHDTKPCVMAFTETWLISVYRDNELAVPGFSLIRTDSPRGRAGRVAIYLRDDFPPPLIYFDFPSQPLADTLWLRFLLRPSDALLIGLLYGSPSSDLQRDCDLLISFRDFIHSHHCSHLLLGNFNAPDIIGDQGILTGGCSSRLHQLVKEEDWTQHVCEPTCYRNGQRPTLPDLVLKNESHLVDYIHTCEPHGKGDHVVLDIENIYYWTGRLAITKWLRNFSKAFLRILPARFPWMAQQKNCTHSFNLQFMKRIESTFPASLWRRSQRLPYHDASAAYWISVLTYLRNNDWRNSLKILLLTAKPVACAGVKSELISGGINLGYWR